MVQTMSENIGEVRRSRIPSDCSFNISLLPEGCIAAAISFTSPRDCCRFALISKSFCSAADSDVVWERFLPADYREIVDGAIQVPGGGPVANMFDTLSKKQIFFKLADQPILVDDGNLSFKLDKSCGKKCYMIAARRSDIAWRDDKRYWKWIAMQESRFQEAAVLLHVWWFDITGRIKSSLLSPNTRYAAYFVFKMGRDHSHGFNYPVLASLIISGEEASTRSVILDIEGYEGGEEDDELPRQRVDGWYEVEIGEYYIQAHEDEEIEMVLKETYRHKSGIIVQGFEIRPKTDD